MDEKLLLRNTEGNVVERLSCDDYIELKRTLCPYCDSHLPDRLIVDTRGRAVFKHFIPRTCEQFECLAMEARLARGCVQRAIRDPEHRLFEE